MCCEGVQFPKWRWKIFHSAFILLYCNSYICLNVTNNMFRDRRRDWGRERIFLVKKACAGNHASQNSNVNYYYWKQISKFPCSNVARHNIIATMARKRREREREGKVETKCPKNITAIHVALKLEQHLERKKKFCQIAGGQRSQDRYLNNYLTNMFFFWTISTKTHYLMLSCSRDSYKNICILCLQWILLHIILALYFYSPWP